MEVSKGPFICMPMYRLMICFSIVFGCLYGVIELLNEIIHLSYKWLIELWQTNDESDISVGRIIPLGRYIDIYL